jgi:hypothetical protein
VELGLEPESGLVVLLEWVVVREPEQVQAP